MDNINTTYLSVGVLIVLLVLPLFFPTGLKPWDNLRSTLLQTFTTSNKIREVSEVTAIRVYPIKSCRGFELSKVQVQSHGLEIDRSWMIVDSKTNEFLTIRQIPQMTLINTTLSEDGEFLQLSISKFADNNNNDDENGKSKNRKTIEIPARPNAEWLAANTKLSQVKIWDIETDGHVYGPEVNASLSEFLNQDVALVYKGPTPRVLRGNGDPRLLGRTQETHFSDVHPILIGSESSLEELNSRLAKKGVDPITIERFRPNIIIKGNVPWSEDSWKLVQFSDSAASGSSQSLKKKTNKPLVMDVVARCTRCQVPNVDPVTAKKHPNEPWDTLMSYRRVDEGMKYKPCFGMLCAPRSEGEIEVGTKFEVVGVTDQHRYIKGF